MPPDSNCVHHVYYCRLSLVCLVVNLVGNTFTILTRNTGLSNKIPTYLHTEQH